MKFITAILSATALFSTAYAGCECFRGSDPQEDVDLSQKCCDDIGNEFRELDAPEGGEDGDGYPVRTHECASVGDKAEDYKTCCNNDDSIAWCFGDDMGA